MEELAVDRVHLWFGQEEEVRVIRLIVKNSIERRYLSSKSKRKCWLVAHLEGMILSRRRTPAWKTSALCCGQICGRPGIAPDQREKFLQKLQQVQQQGHSYLLGALILPDANNKQFTAQQQNLLL
ncbi:hypothetical protein DsansV1_C01g0006111 [Dioscorea sansibarensis]